MAVQLFQIFAAGFRDVDGSPLALGQVYTYVAGSSSTTKTTYTDSGGTVPAAQPVPLDARGCATLYGSGNYKLVVKDSLGATIVTLDNVGIGGLLSAATPVTYLAVADRQATFSISNPYVPGSGNLRVWLNGVRLSVTAGDYVESATNLITLSSDQANAVRVGSVLVYEVW